MAKEKKETEEPAVATTLIHPSKTVVGMPTTFGVSTAIVKPVRYHWFKNGKPLGAPSEPCYSTPPFHPADVGTQYSVTVFGADGTTETSAPVTLILKP